MSEQSAKNVFSAGMLIQANAADGVAISTGYDLKPGETRVGVVRIANLDSLPRRFRLSELGASSDFAPGELHLTIAESGGESPALLFSNEIGALPPEGIDLGEFEAGEVRGYRLTLACSVHAAGSGLERAAGAAYVWSAAHEGEGAMEPRSVKGFGRLVRASSPVGAVIVAGPDMRPGQRQSGEVTIVNLGARAAAFRLHERNAGNGFAADRLGLAIHELHEGGCRRIYLGEIGAVPAEGIDLGRFEAGESRTYRFTVLLARSTPSREFGNAAGAAYDWLATPLGRR